MLNEVNMMQKNCQSLFVFGYAHAFPMHILAVRPVSKCMQALLQTCDEAKIEQSGT